MSEIAIRAQGLGKRYRIGAKEVAYRTIRESVMDAVLSPFRRGGPRPAAAPTIWAVKDVTFDVERGEILGLIGRNGAGKSTLLRILSRITPPNEGRAEIHGRVGSLLEVGTGFHPELTGRENVFLSGVILGMRRAEIRRRFDEIVAFAELDRFVDTPVKHYSSGMYLRLAFAVAAHLDPEILLVDEVLAVGDAAFQRKCIGKMGSVAREGRTILFVSHNMAAVAQLCTRAFWLDSGTIRASGPAQTIVEAYITAGASQRAERSWPEPASAPGDDRVRLRACRVVQDGVLAPTVDINRRTEVELVFETLGPSKDLVTGVSLYNAHGTCILASCDWRPNSLDPGVYRKVVAIPAHTLAEGYVEVLVQCVYVAPHRQSVVLRDALSFDAVESVHPRAVRGPYKGEWPGVVRLQLPWSDAVPTTAAEETRAHAVPARSTEAR